MRYLVLIHSLVPHMYALFILSEINNKDVYKYVLMCNIDITCPSGDNIEILLYPRVLICTQLGIVYCRA